jgi:hypothetical protein
MKLTNSIVMLKFRNVLKIKEHLKKDSKNVNFLNNFDCFTFLNKFLCQFLLELAWTTCTISERRTYIEYLLETLELKDPDKRFLTAKKLLYIAQGTYLSYITISL